MTPTVQKYIEKLEKLVKWFHKNTIVAEWFEDKDHDEYYKLKSEIESLKQQIQEEAITDEDIEAWAKELFDPLDPKIAEEQCPFKIKEVVALRIRSSIQGAKAILNNEIKHIEK